LRFNSIGNYGANSSLGTGGTNAVVALVRNSTATFTGATSAQSSNRNFTLSAGEGPTTESNATITNANTAADRGLTLTGNITATPSTNAEALPSFLVLTGGATAQTNTFSGVFSDGVNANGRVYGLKKEGANSTWIVSNVANTYSGATIVTLGVLEITKLSAGGTASSIGDSSNAATNLRLGGGTLRYAGSGDSTDRLFDLTVSSTLQSSGTGAVNFTNSGSYTASGTASARTLTLGGTNTGDNSLAGGIVDSGTGPNITSLTKADAGKWILSGISTYTGATTVSGGTLVVDGTLGATNISVGSGASFGGDGSVGGAISFSGTSNLLFSTTATLDVAGTVSFTGSFGIANLSGLTNAVSDGTYTLLGGSGSISTSFLNNIGFANAVDLGLGKSAYFDLGGDNLSVVVSAIPEPSTFATLAGAAILAFAAMRRRRAS
jgi:fibronectin-binding autotransporter adhesin